MPRKLPPNVFIEHGMAENVEDLLRVRAYEASRVLFVPSTFDKDTMDGVSEDLRVHLDDYQVIKSTLALRTVEDLYREHSQQSNEHFSRNNLTSGEPSNVSMLRRSIMKSHNSIDYFAYKTRGGNQSFRSDDENSITRVSDVQRNEYQNERIHDHRHWNPLKHFHWKHQPAKANVGILSYPCFTPMYAASEVFVDCVLDTLLCQSFFNPYIVDLIRALTGDYYSDGTQDSFLHDHCATFKTSMMRYFSTSTKPSSSSGLVDSRKDEKSSSTRKLEEVRFQCCE